MIDLIDARVDIAIRVGRLADSSWITRRLCELEMILCAAPAYLERRGTPGLPGDLVSHHWLAFTHDTVEPRQESTLGAAEHLPGL